MAAKIIQRVTERLTLRAICCKTAQLKAEPLVRRNVSGWDAVSGRERRPVAPAVLWLRFAGAPAAAGGGSGVRQVDGDAERLSGGFEAAVERDEGCVEPAAGGEMQRIGRAQPQVEAADIGMGQPHIRRDDIKR
jgi:hypothetical protein